MTGKRLLLAAAVGMLAANTSPAGDIPGFEAKLSTEQKIQQVLSRLTFGARPGDVEEVRRLGVEKWIALQLHPDQIGENPQLEARLKPLTTLNMQSAEIMTKYYQQFPQRIAQPIRISELLPGEQQRKVFNGTAEERRAAIMALDPEKRMKVLAVVPPNVVEGLPDLQKEQGMARQKQQEERQTEMRRMRPPLNDLLSPAEVEVVLHGTPEARATLYASVDADKLRKIAAALPANALAGQPEMRRLGAMARMPQQVIIGDLREAKLYRAIYSKRQLEEVLTDFWFNHFNVFEGKDRDLAMLTSYERDAIRPHVLGRFKDLLLATARHPAMLYYLDNWQSMTSDVFQIGPFAPGPFPGPPQGFARQAHGLNENYGRELLELHTLGVNGGYTQQDVIEVARCFTGWTIRSPNQQPEFAFAAFMHDTGEKTVLGHRIAAGGGEQDGLQVIDILIQHPSTARYISTKLARRFVADDPPAALVDRMTRTFQKTGGDLRAVMEAMLTSREFFSEGAWQSKIKSPLEMVAGAVRVLDANATDTFTMVQKVADMGEPLYAKESPNGYKDTSDTWLSTAGVMARIDFARALANGQIPGVAVDVSRFAGKDAALIARELLHRDASAQTLAAIEHGLNGRQPEPGLIASLVISSPEFQRR
ncbi:MAG TPA: DUF1800 domain-containing protein [Candidatus Acidoferrales bacterium]|nr:DUF1800 domain-containing protein [Bryobacteraceae bacterium]HTS67291.1 DUF1800 domain-containing protein [Candidatus Acidoferrales bacterium]